MKIEIDIDEKTLQKATWEISDFLCWIRGYNAGSEDGRGYPYDIGNIIKLNEKLKDKAYK